jgi:hypothetical protein
MKISTLLDRKSKWTKGAFARSKTMKWVAVDNRRATKFCLLGALEKCYKNQELISVRNKLSNFIYKKYNKNITGFNDDRDTTYTMVRNVVRELHI